MPQGPGADESPGHRGCRNRCESCGGFWVDGGELQELVSAAKDVESSGDPERPLISELEPRDIAILAWIAPGTFTKFQHETRRPTFR